MKLNNKVAIVLGSVKGIGKEIALFLAKEKCNLSLTYYDWEDSLVALQEDMQKTKANHIINKVNLLKPSDIDFLIKSTISKFKKIDILINNIERGGWPILHGKYTEDQWDLEIETCLKAKRWVFDAAYPYLKKSDDGAVINFSSIAGIVGRSGSSSYVFNEGYSCANRGISLLTETWARLCSPNVRVNEIQLGFIDTRHGTNTRAWNLLSDEDKEKIIDESLIKRIGTNKDVVKCLSFLLKDAPFMTGSVIRLDGGYVLGDRKIKKMPKAQI